MTFLRGFTAPVLDLVFEYDCNLKCGYCTVTDEMRRRHLSTEEAAARIREAAARGAQAMCVTGGEPTIRRDLAALVRYARAQGFREVKLQSNGLMFAYPRYVRTMVEAGVTEFHVSVHGHHPRGAESYAALTQGGPEAHGLMLRGIDNLVAAGVSLVADMIVMESTYRRLREGLEDLHRRGVERFELWLVSLTDGNADHPESLPRLADLAPAIAQCLEYGRAHGVEVLSLHVPRCVLRGHEDQVWHPGLGQDVSVVTPDGAFQLGRSRLGGQVKTAACTGCRWYDACPGLRADYVARHGAEEIAAVQV